MEIKTKFNLGQIVYVIFKEENEIWVKVFTDEIKEILITEEGTTYYLKKICEEFEEKRLNSNNRK